MAAPYTQLSPAALPGKRYSFTAKAEAFFGELILFDVEITRIVAFDVEAVPDTLTFDVEITRTVAFSVELV